MIKIYTTSFWQDDLALYKYLKNYGEGHKAKWKNIQLTLDNDYDLVAILTAPHKLHKNFNIELATTFHTEPPQSSNHFKNINTKVSKMYCPEMFWNCNRLDIEKIRLGDFVKTECLSSVTSELSWLEGHRKRIEFIYYLDKVIVDGFDLYGKKYTGEFYKMISAYRGGIDNKLDALIPYEYTFACENTFNENYFTEKILQPILCETLCFYDGCTNIEEFIDNRAFIKIDLDDFDATIETIIKSIQDNEYSKRIDFIRKEKTRIINSSCGLIC